MLNRLRGPRPTAVGALLCALGLLVVMLVAYYVPEAQRLDATALHGFNTLESGVLNRPAFLVALFGGYLPFGPGLILLWIVAVRVDRKREALAATAAMFAAGASAEVLKIVLAHSRFQPVLGDHQVNAASFPSGSVTSAMAMAVAALFVVPARWRIATAAVGAIFVVAVSLGVMISAWHFPSDVIGGILLAAGYGFAAQWALATHGRRGEAPARTLATWRPPRSALWGAVGIAAVAVLGVLFVSAGHGSEHAWLRIPSLAVAGAIAATAAALLVTFGLVVGDDRPNST